MSDMNFVAKLLDGVEVEWKSLGKIATITIGEFVHKDNQDPSAQYPVYNGGTSNTGYYDKYNNTGDKVIVSARGANAGFVNRIYKPYWAGNSCYSIGTKNVAELNWMFVYYFLKNSENKLIGDQQKGGIPAISKKQMEVFQIPIPHPDIQAKIVRILDTFTELTAKLTEELRARKKQYNYYRDQLLSFEEVEVEWKSFGEVARVQRGASPRPIAKFITDANNGIPWIKIGDTSPASKYVNKTKQKITHDGAKKSRILKKGDFIISNSMSFGRPYILNIDGAIHDGWASISDFESQLNSDYLYHYLSSNKVQNYWISKINSGSVSNLNADIIKTLQIPILPLEEQTRIVAILDKFDVLTNSISEGLPCEIELRQQQYEYYRELLLNFPKPKVEA